MNAEKYTQRLQGLESARRRMVDELMQRPFGDRVMADHLESELQEIEEELLRSPPVIGTAEDGSSVYAGKGLKEDDVLLPSDGPSGIETIPQSEWPVYIEGKGGEDQLHIEPYVRFTYNQGSVGSCGAEGGTGAMSAERVARGLPHVLFNPYFVYYTTSGGRDQGSTLSETVAFLRDRGCASAAVWPRSQGWRRQPSEEAYDDAKQYQQTKVVRVTSWDEYGTMLLHTHALYSGYSGHAWFGTRLIAPNRLRYKNSWGNNWGENGYGTLSANRIMWGYGVYVFLAVCEPRE